MKKKYDPKKNYIQCKKFSATLRGNISGRIRVGKYQAKQRGYAVPVVTIDQVIDAMKNQLGLCAACGETLTEGKEGYCIDHSHETGKFRGLLCGRCNTIEGHAKTPERCEAVANYMRQHLNDN